MAASTSVSVVLDGEALGDTTDEVGMQGRDRPIPAGGMGRNNIGHGGTMKHEFDVYMDDDGYWRAGCAASGCDWVSGRCFSEGEAEQSGIRHAEKVGVNPRTDAE